MRTGAGMSRKHRRTGLGLPDRQDLARPSPGLRDTSSVTYAEIRPGTHTPCVGRVTVQAGFLTRGSLSCPRLPGRGPSGNLEENSPLTVAGAAPGSRVSSHRIPLLIQVGSGSCTMSFKSKGGGVSIASRLLSEATMRGRGLSRIAFSCWIAGAWPRW